MDDFNWLREDMRVLRDGQTKLDNTMSAFHERLDYHAKALEEHDHDIKTLTASHNELKGMARGIKWLWALVAAILAVFGIHLGVGK